MNLPGWFGGNKMKEPLRSIELELDLASSRAGKLLPYERDALTALYANPTVETFQNAHNITLDRGLMDEEYPTTLYNAICRLYPKFRRCIASKGHGKNVVAYFTKAPTRKMVYDALVWATH